MICSNKTKVRRGIPALIMELGFKTQHCYRNFGIYLRRRK
jgi:hypothetical protein